jgi:hypothetical protein
MLLSDGGIYTGATGRKPANHTCFESWFYFFTVAYKVNKEQRVQHKLLVQTINNFQSSLVLVVVYGS